MGRNHFFVFFLALLLLLSQSATAAVTQTIDFEDATVLDDVFSHTRLDDPDHHIEINSSAAYHGEQGLYVYAEPDYSYETVSLIKTLNHEYSDAKHVQFYAAAMTNNDPVFRVQLEGDPFNLALDFGRVNQGWYKISDSNYVYNAYIGYGVSEWRAQQLDLDEVLEEAQEANGAPSSFTAHIFKAIEIYVDQGQANFEPVRACFDDISFGDAPIEPINSLSAGHCGSATNISASIDGAPPTDVTDPSIDVFSLSYPFLTAFVLIVVIPLYRRSKRL